MKSLKTARRTKKKPQTLQDWIEAQYRATPGLRRRVNALVKEMEKEMERYAAAKRKAARARKRRARKVRAR